MFECDVADLFVAFAFHSDRADPTVFHEFIVQILLQIRIYIIISQNLIEIDSKNGQEAH